MSNLYEQMDFILSGGALHSLTEFLTPKVGSALVVTPKDTDLEIVDAVGVAPGDLFLRGWAPKLASAFPALAKNKKFEVNFAPTETEWPWAAAIRGKRWAYYILLRESPEPIMEELLPVAGLVSLWQEFHYMETMEERLSRMAYMILATKSTLASVFEPMPLNYFASFISDVIHESLFPRSISIFMDDGSAIKLMEGEDTPPAREGVYAQRMPLSAPVVTKKDAPPYEVVLPIIEPYRLYCLTKWDKMPEEEALGFLELVSNLASRALTINELRLENTDEQNKISSGQYTIHTLSKALDALKAQTDRKELLHLTVDIFTEMTNVEECLLVAWDKELKGYVPLDFRKGGIKTPCGAAALPSDTVPLKDGPQFLDLTRGELSALLKCPWPEMGSMKLAFPICADGRMEGFIAVSSDRAALADGDKLSALSIVAQFTAFNLNNIA